MTRTKPALLLFLTAALLVMGAPARAAQSDAAYNNGKILEFMNAERQNRGVRSVARDSALDAKAQEWANKLAAEGRMYHSPVYGGQAVGYNSWSQNLAYHDDSMTASQAHDLWMASAVHRKNMLDPDFSHVGIAMACSTKSGRGYVMAVVEFGGDGNPSSDTPPRNPQVAGSSDSSRAMSCDGSSGPAPTEPPATAPPATQPPAPASTSTSRPAVSTTRRATGATTTVRKTSTTTRVRGASTSIRVPTTSSPAASSTTTILTTTTTLPEIAAASAGDRSDGGTGILLVTGGALAAFALLRGFRILSRRGKHSARRG